MKTLTKTASALALSLTVALGALGATAAPAKANDDLGKFLVGAVALGIIAAGIANANNNDDTANRRNHNDDFGRHGDRWNHRGYYVPASCAREVQLGHGGRYATVYGEPCLRRNNVSTQAAASCARSGRIYGRTIAYYTEHCLRRSGYRL